MKHILALLLLPFLFVACTANTPRNNADGNAAFQVPEFVAAQFYQEWISYPGNPLRDKLYENSALVTPEFAARTGGLIASFTNGGYDPVLCAQDKPSSFEIVPDPQSGEDTAVITVQETFGEQVVSPQVLLIRTQGIWKIDAIDCPSAANTSDAEGRNAGAAEGEFCGGIAGIPCAEGLACELDGDYPDAGGECVQAD